MNRIFTYMLVGAMLLGIAVGWACNQYLSPEQAKVAADNFSIITDVFLRLIKMIIGPLVFATLAVGIAKMGDLGAVGRVGLKSMAWFMAASLMSLGLGLVLVNLLQPGVDLGIALPDVGASSGVAASGLSLQEFVTHLVPSSIADAMARNEILQIVVFSVFFGVACAGVGDKAKVLVDALEGLSYVMLKVTMFVMWAAPFAVFAAVSAAIAKSGLGVLAVYGKFMGQFYLGIIILWGVLFLAAWAMNITAKVQYIIEPSRLNE